ncbi:DUF5908 family protein [Roseateles amylovorans]|jgi:Family of unknown function (DUF5908)|uniref:DUF5908 family protein n=1 Tax=Roseateles amylovorans TaxID=2978473 RepID=A0ABY6B4G8_9BURK|nr:DUF5908 family protein [Roseateles amylovorans]UXH79424.1 DUF5908 family protein [Roseateles amylovorans]
MSIEVRQLLIRTQVTPAAATDAPRPSVAARDLQRLREQVLAECKTWLAERLRAQRER